MSVTYTAVNFRIKNKDEVPRDLERCIEGSLNPAISEIWTTHGIQNLDTAMLSRNNMNSLQKRMTKFLAAKFRK